MQGRTFDARRTLVGAAIALAAAIAVMTGRAERHAPAATEAAVQPVRSSQTLGADEFHASAAPTLAESLIAVDLLVKAGKLPTLAESLVAVDLLVKAGELPTLAESLIAVDLLVRAGKLPTLAESLVAVDLLVKAGKLPTLAESLVAADLLIRAGVISAPAPPIDEILRAVSLLSEAGAARLAQDAAPPPMAGAPEPTPGTSARTVASRAPITPPTVRSGYMDDAFTAGVFSQVNQRRLAAGLQPVTVEPRLADAAVRYARVLTDYNWFSHTGPDGSTLVTRAEAAGFPFTVQIGEVLAWGSNGWTAAEIVQAWIDSPAHRDQILNPAYTRAGAGCYFTSTSHTTVRCAMEFAAG